MVKVAVVTIAIVLFATITINLIMGTLKAGAKFEVFGTCS